MNKGIDRRSPENFCDINGKKKLIKPIYFWKKLAKKPDKDREDKLDSYVVEDDPAIWGVIRNLESKIIGREKLLDEISPQIPSVKKWINRIREKYPERIDDIVENLIDTFRANLHPRSKPNFFVGLLLLNNCMMLVHYRRDPSLAEIKDKIYPVNLILHPKNVMRVAIIKNEDGKTTFSVFEYNRKWSKGNAEFWGIEPEDVSWESLGSIVLRIELDSFSYKLQLPLEPNQLEDMIRTNKISTSGRVKIGREEGRITVVDVFRKSMEFPEFYDFYITQKWKIEEHRKKFKQIINPNDPRSYDSGMPITYRYEENEEKIYEITTGGKSLIHSKSHPRFTICFFTKLFPGIRPQQKLLYMLHESIFGKNPLDICHVNERTSDESVTVGCLNIYNEIELKQRIFELSENFLNLIQDANKKTRCILQYYFCQFWKKNTDNKFIQDMFTFIEESIVASDLRFEFENAGILEKEKHLQFKSASEVNPKPSKFVRDTLVPEITRYVGGSPERNLCILYGIEDNGKIVPILHLGNDQINTIEKIANEEISRKIFDQIHVDAYPIPYREGIILLVFLVPVIE